MLISHLRHYQSRISDHFIDTSRAPKSHHKRKNLCHLLTHKVSFSFMDFLDSFVANIIAAHTEGNDVYLALVQYPISQKNAIMAARKTVMSVVYAEVKKGPQGKFQIILSKVISIWFKKIICDDCISQRPIWVTSLSSL